MNSEKLEDQDDDLNAFLSIIYKCKKCFAEFSSKEELIAHVKSTHSTNVGKDITQSDSTISTRPQAENKSLDEQEQSTPVTTKSPITTRNKKRKTPLTDEHENKKKAYDVDEAEGNCNVEPISDNTGKVDEVDKPIQVEVVDSSKSFKCPDCQKTYKQKHSLESHCRKMHQTQLTICPKCRVRCKSDEEYQMHILSHHKNTFKCVMCDYTNIHWHRLKVHMETHNKPDKHECDNCHLTFASSFALCNHKRFAHLGGFHLCDECGFNAMSKYALVQHRMVAHSDQFLCQICGYSCDNQIDFDMHMTSRHQQSFVCKSCSSAKQKLIVKFSSKEELQAHVAAVHPNDKCFFCEHCNYVAKLRHHLTKHMLVHTGEKPYKCKFEGCGFSTKDHKNLKQHMVMKHRKPGELVCRQCRFVTTNQNEWDVHKAMNHMKVYQCNECDFKSRNSASIRRHRLSKHIASDKMRYPCPQCSYRTNLKESLHKHTLTHAIRDSQFVCVLCHQSFLDRQNTVRHLAEEHPSQTVFLCKDCTYMTQKQQVFAQHNETHLSNQSKPFKCDQCTYAGRTAHLLKSHKANKHAKSHRKINNEETPSKDGPTTSSPPTRNVQFDGNFIELSRVTGR
uniref:ZF(C2H2)-116 zinc finger protein n=1 Tax=Phallusia mammillata TaxID=59560 RepID=A0A6F9DY38_9ASCI|nr:ZF(C2H2)-116 zinc finger protein [Phallusia mammillata]